MGTNASAFIVNNSLDESDEELLRAFGFTSVRRIQDSSTADFGFIRYKDSFLLFTYGMYDSAVNGAIEYGESPLSRALCAIFPKSEVLAIVLQGSTDLAGFSLYSSGVNIRRWAVAAAYGTLVDSGKMLDVEAKAVADGVAGEEVVHAVMESIVTFDLLEVFEARDAGAVEEALFSVAVADA